ncbi:MAG: bacillithiol system redox-active protein YtxJ [Owenweeksia sp.]
MQWKELTDIAQLEEVDLESSTTRNGIVIFKHSTRCAISSMVWGRFKRNWNKDEKDIPVYYLDLLKHRDVSNRVAEHYRIQHQSPQVLLIRNGECVYDASHNAIAPAYIEGILND